MPGANDLGWGAWISDGRIISTRTGSDGVVITGSENAERRVLLRQGVRESFLCWNEREARALLRDQDEHVFSVSQDNASWTRIHAPGYLHCVSARVMLAWTTRDYDAIHVRHLHNKDGDPRSVPDVIDARHSIAWSHSGEELAFVNADANDSRRTICVWNRRSDETRFIVPWIGKPNSLAWSPDDRFLVLEIAEADGLFLVDARGTTGRPILELFDIADEGGVLKCGAWRA